MLCLEAVGQQKRLAGSNVVCFAAAAGKPQTADVLCTSLYVNAKIMKFGSLLIY